MKITKRQIRRIILEYISPEQREKDKETLAKAVDLEPNNPDRPDLDLQYVKNLDDGKFYRLPTKVAKEIDTYKRDIWQINKMKLKDDDGQWASVSKLLGTSNWEWSGMQGNEYGQMNDQRREREKAAKWAADPEGEAAKKKHYDDLYAKAATDAGLDVVSGKVEVEWDLGDTEFEDMPYDQALKAAGLPAVVELPGEFEEDELTDWLSDEYGFTHHGWAPINESRMKITKRQLKKLVREAIEEDQLGMQGPWAEVAAEYLTRGDSVSAMNQVLNRYMMDDTWRMEEDALEDLLIDLGQNPTPEDVEATSEEWLTDYRAGKYRPQTKEEQQADWDRGAKPRTDYGRKL